nr:ABC transporter B family member 1-like [Physcomitrium patens]|eukprot:XP_024359026.1 ABC transporter B family member 1-like [Physcomitrella patens]
MDLHYLLLKVCFLERIQSGCLFQVSERGVQLSGGQKQRIAIARAILRKPRILLLDEATSAVDASSERLVQEALDKVVVGRTTVSVAHRLSTVRNANIIAVVQEGTIVEMGDHQSLLEKQGAYFSLFQLQGNQMGKPSDTFSNSSSPTDSNLYNAKKCGSALPISRVTEWAMAAFPPSNREMTLWRVIKLNRPEWC